MAMEWRGAHTVFQVNHEFPGRSLSFPRGRAFRYTPRALTPANATAGCRCNR